MSANPAPRDVRLTVLLVEDEALLRMDAEWLLESAGFEVLSARNGDEALDILSGRDGVDLLFSDIDMPGHVNGLQLATMVRFRWPGTRVVITSGGATPGERGYGELDRFIPKPYRHEEVVRTLLAA